jgi:phenylacetate-CoA ligase
MDKLPLLTREDVVNHFDDLRSSAAKGYRPILATSSGTTGQKLGYMIPHALRRPFQAANQWRYYGWAGVKLGDHRATLGARIFATRPPYWAWNRWENQLLLSSHHLNYENLSLYAQLLDRFSIDFIQGHPSAVAVLAEYLLMEGTSLPMKGVFTTGETVYPDDREMIENAFACRLLDSYGMGEWAAAAQQCNRTSGYHEISEACIVELDPLGDGSYEVIGTSLLNYAMPFIRYRTGDIAVPHADSMCECGRGLPIKISEVYGRIDDKIILPERVILPVTVRMHMKPLLLPGETYQVIQEDFKTIRVLFTGPVDSRRMQEIEMEMMKFLGPRMAVFVEHTEEIRTQRNKVRNVISTIAKR